MKNERTQDAVEDDDRMAASAKEGGKIYEDSDFERQSQTGQE